MDKHNNIRLAAVTVALTMSISPALAGGITRIPQSSAILFEEGRILEFGFAAVDPEASGFVDHPLAGRLESGDALAGFGSLSLAYKQAINDRTDVAIILDQPYGADTAYPLGSYPLAGTRAQLDSLMLTGLVRHRVAEDFSVIGGLRIARTEGNVSIPTFSYSMSADAETDLGYVLGAAWEKPEIAARVALTYHSRIRHDFHVTENGFPSEDMQTDLPQSLALEFQTGVAADTLVFGSVRWTDWTEFSIAPVGYTAAFGDDLVGYTSDTISVELGVGRKLTENFSAGVTVGWESASDDPGSNLSPYDGEKSIGLAGIWTQGNVSIQGGIRYISLGDTRTKILDAQFEDGKAVAAGMKVGYRF